MRHSHPTSVHLARRRRWPAWAPTVGWMLLFVGLSVAVLALSSYSL